MCCQKLDKALAHPVHETLITTRADTSSDQTCGFSDSQVFWSLQADTDLKKPQLLIGIFRCTRKKSSGAREKNLQVRGAAACAQLWSTLAKMRAGWSSWSLLSFEATIRADPTNINGSLFHSLECSSFLNGCLATMAADQKFRLQSHFSFHSAGHQDQFAWRCHQ